MSPSTSDLLEICLNRIEAGLSINEAVAPYPERAAELRALLEVALTTKPADGSISVPSSAQVNSRKRLLAQAQQLQQQRGSAYWWALLHFLRGNVGSLGFGIAILLLFFLALNSVRALPGDSLYPVKLAAEQAGVSLPGSAAAREERVQSYENQRTEEVVQMIQLKRTGQVSFGGFLQNSLNASGWQVDQIGLQLPESLEKQAVELTGAHVEIKGFLNEQGIVAVETLQARLETLEGTLTRADPGLWLVGSQEIRITSITQVSGTPRPGSRVSAQVAALKDSSAVLAIRAEVVGEAEPSATGTVMPQPTNGQKLQATSEPDESPTSVLTPQDDHKSRPIIQPSNQATPTPDPSGSSGQESDHTKPTDDHHEDEGHDSSGSGDNKENGH